MSTQILVLTGPESSGKTSLARSLSARLHAPLVTEAARDYLAERMAEDPAWRYSQTDILAIARRQYQLEREALDLDLAPPCIVCDTDLLVLMIWSEEKYGDCDRWIGATFERQLNHAPPRHYLLCDWRIPWRADPQRENPRDRDRLYQRYLRKLEHYGIPFTQVSGCRSRRLAQALEAAGCGASLQLE